MQIISADNFLFRFPEFSPVGAESFRAQALLLIAEVIEASNYEIDANTWGNLYKEGIYYCTACKLSKNLIFASFVKAINQQLIQKPEGDDANILVTETLQRASSISIESEYTISLQEGVTNGIVPGSLESDSLKEITKNRDVANIYCAEYSRLLDLVGIGAIYCE